MAMEPTFTTSDDYRQLQTQVVFNADAPLTLSVSNASGNVDVSTDRTLPAGTIRVAANRTDGRPFDEDDHHFAVKVDGNAISVHPDWQFASGVSGLARRIRDQLQHGFRPEDWNLSRLKLSPELDFNILVTLPAVLANGSQIKIRTASGEVSARDFAAGTSIVTASGDVDAHDLTGTVAIHTASGDVEAAHISESLEVNTASGDVSITGGDAWLAARSASGDVTVRDTQLRNARITTVSGDISLAATLDNRASYGMETVSGDISLAATLPGSDASATLGFGTLSGSSHVGEGWQQRKRREWHAGEGEPTIAVNVKTVSGDLTARARLDDDVTARAIAMPRSETTEDDDIMGDDFRAEMKAFGREMKQLGKEMKHLGHGPGHMGHHAPPTPPTPPMPPMPPMPAMPPMPPMPVGDDEEAVRDYEEAMRDYEQQVRELEEEHAERLREHEEQRREIEQDHARRLSDREQRQREQQRDKEQRLRDQEQRQRDREQRRLDRQRDHEQRRLDREQRRMEKERAREERHQAQGEHRRDRDDSHIFTAGPSGVDYRNDTTPVEPGASHGPIQPTEPVAPPEPYTEETTMTETGTSPQDTTGDDRQPDRAAGTAPTPIDPRLRVLEALEKGEIDIEDALARLESSRNAGGSAR